MNLNALKHGLGHLPLYDTWRGMMQRCYNEKHKSYNDYGGRGIEVCEDWHHITCFAQWAFSNGYQQGLMLDREDNDKGYTPQNCRFVTSKRSARNRRTSLMVTVYGEEMTFADAVERYGNVEYRVAKERFRKHGWSIMEALLEPKKCPIL